MTLGTKSISSNRGEAGATPQGFGRRPEKSCRATRATAIAMANLAFGAFALNFGHVAYAQDARHELHIDAQPIGTALKLLAEQTGLQVLVLSQDTVGIRSPDVHGNLTSEEALLQVLDDSGLTYRKIDAKTVAIRRKPPEIIHTAQALDAPVVAQAGPPTVSADPAPAAPEEELQEIQVSASAISISGYEAPTPTTTVGVQQLEGEARLDLGDVLRSLPAFSASISSQSGGTMTTNISGGIGGLDLLNLRNLGVVRTLVLFDGQRVVQASSYGGVDVGLIPATLVERIDTVLGGASATWGSDAVSGLVNVIINKRFNGVRVNVTESNNWQGLHRQDKFDIALGMPFADGRGHVEVAGSYWNIPGVYRSAHDPHGTNGRLMGNPACTNYVGVNAVCPPGEYKWHAESEVSSTLATPGGIITAGLNGKRIPLTNTAFGLNGQPYVFNTGTVTETFCYSCTPNFGFANFRLDSVPLTNKTGFGLLNFKFNDAFSASLQLNYARNNLQAFATSRDQAGTVPIYATNPYLPTAIQEALASNNLPGFLLGTNLLNNRPDGGDSVDDWFATLGAPVATYERTLRRFVLTFNGDLSEKWSWNAYYMHGQMHTYEFLQNNIDIPNLLQAENAVRVTPAMNAAVPSLPVGSITCAANVPLDLLPGGASGLVASTAIVRYASPGCQPLNVMGLNSFSQEALDYIRSPAIGANDTMTDDIRESVVAASVQGQLPFGFAAGPVATAAGLLYRRESEETRNCGAACDARIFHAGNFINFDGGYNIKELNAEVNVPILKDHWVQTLSGDVAARVSDYSTSGAVETYKFGVITQVNDWLRFRGSYSYDIRAPNLFELFTPASPVGAGQVDPRTNLSVDGAARTSRGNPNLEPEIGETRTFGFVFTPMAGLTASIDWYDINIKHLINGGFEPSVSVAQCQAGVPGFCENFIYGIPYTNERCVGPKINSCPLSYTLLDVIRQPQNADRETMTGLDFNADWRTRLGPGAIDTFGLVNYIFANGYWSQGKYSDPLNSLSRNETIYSPVTNFNGELAGIPKFRSTLGVTYSQGGLVGTVQSRMVGAAWLVHDWIDTNFISNEDNRIPFTAYFDLRLSYKWDNGLQIYGAIDNLNNKAAPLVLATAQVGVRLIVAMCTIFSAECGEPGYDSSCSSSMSSVLWRVCQGKMS